MTVWQYDCVTEWLCGNRTVWQHDCVTIWLCDNMTVWLWRTTSRSMRRRWAGVGRWAGLVAGWEMPGRGKAKAADLSSGAVIAFLNIYQQKTYHGLQLTRWPVSGDGRHSVTRWCDQDRATLGPATCWLLAACGAECDCEGEWCQ